MVKKENNSIIRKDEPFSTGHWRAKEMETKIKLVRQLQFYHRNREDNEKNLKDVYWKEGGKS